MMYSYGAMQSINIIEMLSYDQIVVFVLWEGESTN